MIFTRVIALLLTLAPLPTLAQTATSNPARCLVLIDQVESLFQATNRGFGPANVQILHDLTADFLNEQGYDAGSDLITSEPHPLYTHALTVEVSKKPGSLSLVLVLSPLGENGVNAAGTKITATQRILLASAPITGGASKRKAREARDQLYQDAEDQYFLAIKKLRKCE